MQLQSFIRIGFVKITRDAYDILLAMESFSTMNHLEEVNFCNKKNHKSFDKNKTRTPKKIIYWKP